MRGLPGVRGACLLLLLCLPTIAAAQLRLPLDGYYRPGKYMPVSISGLTGEVTIGSEQSLETAIMPSSGAAGVVAPFLPIDTLRQAYWRAGGGERQVLNANWRPLGPDDRLVGFTTVDMDLARELFPGASIIPIRLDPTLPLPGPLTAWETLDAVVLDNPSLVDDAMLGELLGGGVTVAVRTDVRPDMRWPWRQSGQHWVASHELAGPTRAAEYPSALAPVQGWRADWPAAFRQRIVLYAVGFGVLAMGLALLRSRWTPLAIVIVSAATVGGLALWWAGRSPVVQRGGQVLVVGEHLAQTDTWTYRAAARGTKDRIPFSPLMRPFFELPGQNAHMRMALRCDGDGRPAAFEYQLPPSLKSAFLARSLQPRSGQVDPEKADGSPLSRLAQRVYLRPRHRIWGLVPSSAPEDWDVSRGDWWGMLVIEDVPSGQRGSGGSAATPE